MNKNLACKIFNLLEGKWIINRTIVNIGKLEGLAKFEKTSDPNELIYQENGLFEFYEDKSRNFEATKQYIYRLVDLKDIHVYFKEEPIRLFHKLGIDQVDANKNTFKLEATHLCSMDTYDILYEFNLSNELEPEFNITYNVNGPNKSYLSKTHFKK